MKDLNNLKKLCTILSVSQRKALVVLIFLMLFGAVIEMLSVASIVPFLSVVTKSVAPEVILGNAIFSNFPYLDDLNLEIAFGVMFLTSVAASVLINICITKMSYIFSHKFASEIAVTLYSNTLWRPYSWHLNHNSGTTLSAIQKINSVLFGIVNPIILGIVSLVLAIGIILTLLLIDLQMAILSGVCFVMIYFASTYWTKRKFSKNSKLIAEYETNRLRSAQDGLRGIREIIIGQFQAEYIKEFSNFDLKMRVAQAENEFYAVSPRYLIEGAGLFVLIGLAYCTSNGYIGDNLNSGPGALSVIGAIAFAAQKLLPQMQRIYYALSSIKSHSKNLVDVIALIESNNVSRLSKLIGLPLESETQACCALIKLKDVSFKYENDERLILEKVNFDINKGDKVGLVGKSGGGKSTLLDMLSGLLKPLTGNIFIEGHILDEGNASEWQKKIAYVSQKVHLADTTILENIAFGVEIHNIDMDKLVQVAQQAHIYHFIQEMPNKFNSKVGEQGVNLSGGQIQRIGLARALYSKPAVIFLDEATSALDTDTEIDIMKSIEELSTDITVIMIAHRTSTLTICNRIFEVSDCAVNEIDAKSIQ